MTDLNQLLLQFNYNQNFNYDDFFVSKSNFFAFQLIKKWPRWEKNILNIHGEKFCGNLDRLGKLFYKHDSPKGSGIGLYLVKKLVQRQGGQFVVSNEARLLFELKFKRGEELE